MTSRDCEYCGTYARRCQSDRDDGETYCEITGIRIDWRLPMAEPPGRQPSAYAAGISAARLGRPPSANPYAGAQGDHRASWAAGYREGQRTACDAMRTLASRVLAHDPALVARLMEALDKLQKVAPL